MLRTPSLAATSATLLACAAATLASSPAWAQSGAQVRGSCPAKPGEVARDRGAVLWKQGGVLWGCAPEVRQRGSGQLIAPRRDRQRLGRYAGGSRAALGGVTAAWTVRSGGADQIFGFDLRSGRGWLGGVATLPAGSAPATPDAPSAPGDERVAGLAATSDAAAWVTGAGTLVLALRRRDPTETALDDSVVAYPDAATPRAPDTGLVSGAQFRGRLLTVGRWPEPAQARAAAKTLRLALDEFVGGEDEFCSVAATFRVTVRPLPSAPPTGAVRLGELRQTRADC